MILGCFWRDKDQFDTKWEIEYSGNKNISYPSSILYCLLLHITRYVLCLSIEFSQSTEALLYILERTRPQQFWEIQLFCFSAVVCCLYWRIGTDYRGLVLHPPNKIISNLRWRRGCFAESPGVCKKCPGEKWTKTSIRNQYDKVSYKGGRFRYKGSKFRKLFY